MTHARRGHAKALGDLGMTETIQTVIEERCACLARQLTEQVIDLGQLLQGQGLFFRAGLHALRSQREFFQIGTFQRMAAKLVDQQPFGDGGEQGSGFARGVQVGATEQADEGVLAQVFGALRAVQAFAQPAEQPLTVIAIKQTDQLLIAGILNRHAHLARSKLR